MAQGEKEREQAREEDFTKLRKYVRTPFYTRAGIARGSGGPWTEAEVLDISLGGVHLRFEGPTPPEYSREEPCSVKFHAKEEDKIYRGSIAWVEPTAAGEAKNTDNAWETGVNFGELSREEKRRSSPSLCGPSWNSPTSSPGKDPFRRRVMKKIGLFLLILASVMLLTPPCLSAEPLDGEIFPDPVEAANNFITGLTGSSPQALGLAGDARDLADIGKAVLEGDFAGATNKLGEFTAGKMISYTAPAIGQVIAIGNLGKMAGDAAAEWVGQKNFEKIYTTMLETVGPVEKWPKTPAAAKRDEFFQATMAAEYRYLETYLIKEGYADNTDEAYDVAVEMILAKGNFERLCDEYGLEGKDRTYEKLQQEIRIEAEVAAEIAREREIARAERLEQERLEREKAEAEKAAAEEDMDLEAELEAEMAALEEEKQQAQAETPEPEPEKPSAPRPDDVVVVETKPQEQPESTPEPAPKPERVLAWDIAPSAGDDQTVFAVTVTNVSNTPVTGFSCSIDPTGPYSDGGVGWGTSPSFSTIAPGASISFTALAMGDVTGLAFSFSGNGKVLGSDSVSSVHAVKEKAENQQETAAPEKGAASIAYEGVIKGNGFEGELRLIVSGRNVTGAFHGEYWNIMREGFIEATLSGTFDPDSGQLTATWSGITDYKEGIVFAPYGSAKEGRKPVSGELTGTKSGTFFSGEWLIQTGADFTGTSRAGTWEAEGVSKP